MPKFRIHIPATLCCTVEFDSIEQGTAILKEKGWCDVEPVIEESDIILGENIKATDACVWTDDRTIEETCFVEEDPL